MKYRLRETGSYLKTNLESEKQAQNTIRKPQGMRHGDSSRHGLKKQDIDFETFRLRRM